RTDENWFGETPGEIEQRIDALRWRGQRVTLEASARIEAVTAASRGYLWLEVTGPGGTTFYRYEPITSHEWGEHETSADIPDDAEEIRGGFAFVGPGQAWLDAVSLGPDRRSP
ncbi:MAG: hypothetical protein R3195_20490, partial [Gemmatimonadota bacterium]|nr:hypothetical protein [Gemmatimonadota bacterium]